MFVVLKSGDRTWQLNLDEIPESKPVMLAERGAEYRVVNLDEAEVQRA